MNTKTVLLTGVTGVFGKFLLSDLLKYDLKVILLVRAKSQSEAERRVRDLLRSHINNADKISVIKSDLTDPQLGLTSNDYINLAHDATHILHAAASTKFNLPMDEARRNNVETTRALLSLAEKCGKLIRFGFISTAYVAGKRSGVVLEEEFEHKEGFLNTYEESKYEAERLVRSKLKKLPIVIFRPSLIITPYKKSDISPVNALTLGLFFAQKGFLPVLPGKEENQLDIIEGSITSNAIIQIFLKDRIRYSCYQITSATNSPYIEDFIHLIEKQSDKKLPIRFCGDMDTYSAEVKKVTRFRPDIAAIYKKTQSFLPELAFPKIYNNKNLIEELNLSNFSSDPINTVESLLK